VLARLRAAQTLFGRPVSRPFLHLPGQV